MSEKCVSKAVDKNGEGLDF